MPNIEVNGQSIHFVDSGGDGRAVILSHSMLLDAVTLEPLIEGLAADGYRVVAFDARGHGRTRFDGKDFDFTDHSLDLLALADHLGIATFIAGGEEQGAGIALFTALLAPERVTGLVLVNISGRKASAAEKMAVESTLDFWTTQGPTPQSFGLVATAATGSPEAADALMARWQESQWSQMRPAGEALLARRDIVNELPVIQCPAVVVHGSSEFFIPIDEGKELAENLGGPTLFEVVETHQQNLSIVSNPATVAAVRRLMSALFA